MQLVSVVIIMVKYFISAADLFIFTFNWLEGPCMSCDTSGHWVGTAPDTFYDMFYHGSFYCIGLVLSIEATGSLVITYYNVVLSWLAQML